MLIYNTDLIRGTSTTTAAVINTAAVVVMVVVVVVVVMGLVMPSEAAGACRAARDPTVPVCAVLIWLQATGRQPTMPATFFLVGKGNELLLHNRYLQLCLYVLVCACVDASTSGFACGFCMLECE